MEKERKPKHFIHQPEYPGGQKAMSKFIYEQLRYPASALETGTEGTVMAEMEINHKGAVVDVRILLSLGKLFDEEATRVLKMLKFEVAKNRGIRVLFHKKVQVRFKKPVTRPQPAQAQIQYTLTPPESPAQKAPEPAPTANIYTYTIKLG